MTSVAASAAASAQAAPLAGRAEDAGVGGALPVATEADEVLLEIECPEVLEGDRLALAAGVVDRILCGSPRDGDPVTVAASSQVPPATVVSRQARRAAQAGGALGRGLGDHPLAAQHVAREATPRIEGQASAVGERRVRGGHPGAEHDERRQSRLGPAVH
jgi:hypothetical protein